METLPVVPNWVAGAWLKAKHPSIYTDFSALGTAPDHVKNFYVAYAAGLEQIKEIQSQLQKAIQEGISFTEWKKTLALKGIELPNATTVWRTNIYAAVNESRYQRMAEDVDEFPYLMYEAIEDSRTRPNHAANDGLVMRYDDPAWEGHTPQLGFNCRCRLINLTASEARSKRKHSAPPPNSNADSPEWGKSPFKRGARTAQIDAATPPEDLPSGWFDRLSADKVLPTDAVFDKAVSFVAANMLKSAAAIQSNIQKAFLALTPAEQKSMAWYATGGFMDARILFNKIEAGIQTYTFTQAEKEVGAALLNLRSAINKLPVTHLLESKTKLGGVGVANRTLSITADGANKAKYLASKKTLDNLKLGTVVAFGGLQSYNVQAATYRKDADIEIIITKNITGKYIGNLSPLHNGASDDEVLYWSPKLKFLRKENTVNLSGGSMTRYYFEETKAAATVELAEESGTEAYSNLSLFGVRVDEYLRWVA
jgi:SPP1 gp7 family putative phage head morphogenesis protein